MNEHTSSGIYIIDKDYTVINFNETAKQVYPVLRSGEKCHKLLMKLDVPCPDCPVYNHIVGPRTYMDPIRNVMETVEAFALPMPDGTMGHGLLFTPIPEKANPLDSPVVQKRKLMVVESNEKDRQILRELLSSRYDLLEAVDSASAMELLETHYRSLSLILLNLAMPNRSGYAFLEQLHSDQLLSSIPVIVMTGDADLSTEERCVSLGAVEFLAKPFDPTIVRRRIRNVIRMNEVAASLSAVEMDDLTGLYTRPAFFHHAKRLLDQNPNTLYDIAAVDISNFKRVNHLYGEAAGDKTLKSIADFLRAHIPSGILARLNSDLFIAIFPSIKGDKETMYNAARLLTDYAAQAPYPNITLKCGIYRKVDRTLPISEMCNKALIALKSIKRNRKRLVALFNGPTSQKFMKSQNYEFMFKEALEKKEFVLYFQPKYDPYTEAVIGSEALVRWNHDGIMIPPAEFLPSFEENGLIGQLDEYVFRMVCEYQRSLLNRGHTIVPISVNISRKSMYEENVVERYRHIAADNGISPQFVPIEITESASVGVAEIKPFADAFYAAGFPLHMDDFGSGHSSLNDLNMFHFDVVKIDKSLIDHIGDKRGELLLTYTMVLGKELGLRLVAEGVESEEQLAFLKKNGCDAIQGYYFSRPLPIEEFEQKVFGHTISIAPPDTSEPETILPADSPLHRTVNQVLHDIPGGFFTYEVGGEGRILRSNDYLWEMFGCHSEEEFMAYVGGTFRGIVCPEDRDRVFQSIHQQIQRNPLSMDYVEYHIVRKDGTRVPVVDYGRLEKRPEGDIFYVFLIPAEQ